MPVPIYVLTPRTGQIDLDITYLAFDRELPVSGSCASPELPVKLQVPILACGRDSLLVFRIVHTFPLVLRRELTVLRE